MLIFTVGGGQFSYAAYRLLMMAVGPKENTPTSTHKP